MVARQPFHIDEPLVVRRRFDGFRPGDPFDWKALGVNVRRVATMFRSGLVVHGTAEAREPEPVAAPVAAPELPELPATDSVQFVKAGDGPWYNVMCGGVILNEEGKLRGLKAAQEWAAANGIK
jgi:hypothetical protein